MPGPDLARTGIPSDLNRLIWLERSKVGLVHKGADANMAQVRYLREYLADGDVVTGADGQRVERTLDRRVHSRGADFLLEGMEQVFGLLHAKACTVDIESRPAGKVIFSLLSRLKCCLGFGERVLILIQIVLRRSVFGHELFQRLLRSFETRNLDLRLSKVTFDLRHFARRASGPGVAEIVLCREQIRPRLGELRAKIGGGEGQDRLAAAQRLTFGGEDFFNKRRELDSCYVGIDRFDFAVTRDRGAQVVARDVRNLNLGRLVAPSQTDEKQHDQNNGQDQPLPASFSSIRHAWAALPERHPPKLRDCNRPFCRLPTTGALRVPYCGMLYCFFRMPVVFVVARNWMLRAGVRAELRERGIEALGMESSEDVGKALAEGTTPSAIVLDATEETPENPAFQQLARLVPVVLIASRTLKSPPFPAAAVLNRPVRIGDVVACVCRILQGCTA